MHGDDVFTDFRRTGFLGIEAIPLRIKGKVRQGIGQVAAGPFDGDGSNIIRQIPWKPLHAHLYHGFKGSVRLVYVDQRSPDIETIPIHWPLVISIFIQVGYPVIIRILICVRHQGPETMFHFPVIRHSVAVGVPVVGIGAQTQFQAVHQTVFVRVHVKGHLQIPHTVKGVGRHLEQGVSILAFGVCIDTIRIARHPPPIQGRGIELTRHVTTAFVGPYSRVCAGVLEGIKSK